MSEVKLSNTFWHHAIRLGFLGEKAEEQVGTNPTFTVEEREKFMKKITNNILKGVTEPNGQYALSFIQKHLDTQTRKTDSMTHYFRQISVKVQELRRLRDVVHDAQTEAVAAVRRYAHRNDDSQIRKIRYHQTVLEIPKEHQHVNRWSVQRLIAGGVVE